MITRFKTDFETTDNYRMPVCIGHGECVELQARLENGGVSVDLNDYTLSAIYQPLSAIGKHEWYQCNVENNLSSALVKWTNHNDFGSEGYRIFLYAKKGDEVSYPAIWDMRMYATPGFNPETVEPLPKIIDFNDYTILNAPWIDIDTYNGDIQRIDAAIENHSQEIDTIDGTLENIGNALNSEIQRATSAETSLGTDIQNLHTEVYMDIGALQEQDEELLGRVSYLETEKQDNIYSSGILAGDGIGTVSAITIGSGLDYTDGTLKATAQSQIATRDIMYANQKAPIYINYGQSGQKQIGSVIEFAGWDKKESIWLEDITTTTVSQYPGFVVGVYIPSASDAGLPENWEGFHTVFVYRSIVKSGQRKYATVISVPAVNGCIELDDTSTSDISTGTYTLNFYDQTFPWQTKTAKYTPILVAQFDKSWGGTHPHELTHSIEPYTGGVKYKNTATDDWIDSDIRTYYKYYLVPQAGSVKSVNGKTGVDITLTASDISATNTQSIQANLERIDAEIGDVETILNSL